MNSRQEAISIGIPLASPKNDKLRRAPWHNYRLPGLYMLTLVIKDRKQLLGKLIIDPHPKVVLSVLGKTILADEIKKISIFYPNVKVWKQCIMPDHIHMIVEVCEPFKDKGHLGFVVSGFKAGCNKAYRHVFRLQEGSMFEPHYNDRIILPGMQYQRWKNYMDDNPRRLAIKQAYPEYFKTRYAMNICGDSCQVFGNLFLLQNPDKMEVIAHRTDSEADYSRKHKEWMACGERGGVLVSAAIAKREKDVVNEALDKGYNVIQLCDNGFGPYYKPAGYAFNACAAGQLLMVSPWEYSAEKKRIRRDECLKLNRMAMAIANM